MKNILIICGAEKTGNAGGRYNRSLAEAAVRTLRGDFQVESTHIENGYDIEGEQAKLKRADCVIYQFPVFWFNCPSSLKRYFDQVFERGVLYERRVPYGTGGLMKGKHYLLSTTWNAPEAAFGDMTTFYQGRSVDEALISIHQANRYVGMTPLPSFAAYNVITDPNYEATEARWVAHLRAVLSADVAAA